MEEEEGGYWGGGGVGVVVGVGVLGVGGYHFLKVMFKPIIYFSAAYKLAILN